MGCGGSKQEDVEGKSRNDAIENQLKKDRMNMRYVLTLSLLLEKAMLLPLSKKQKRLVSSTADHSLPPGPFLFLSFRRIQQ